MNKRRGLGRFWAALLILCCLYGTAAAELKLPDAVNFSPGIARYAANLGEGKPLEAEFTVSADKAFYVRDMSVLAAILKGARIRYEADGTWEKGSDRLSLAFEDEPLLNLGLFREDGRAAVSVGEEIIGLPADGLTGRSPELPEPLVTLICECMGPAALNRIPLSAFESALKALPGTLTGGEPFTTGQTWSDDGLRFTRLDLSGSLLLGEDLCRVEGYIRTPGGKEPKDTVKISITNAERGTDLLLEMSSLHKASVTRKNAAGQTETNTTLKLSGKWQGYGLTTRLIISEQNNWTVKDGKLYEKLLVVVTLGHTDKTPGRRKLRLNDMSGKLVLTGTLESSESEALSFSGKLTADLDMDGNNTLSGTVNMGFTSGGEPAGSAPVIPEEMQDIQAVLAAFERAVPQMAAKIYARLSQSTKENIGQGL